MNVKTVYMLTILLPGIAAGQMVSADTSREHGDHGDHGVHSEQSNPNPFAAANADMMLAMHNLVPTGDVDYDFMRGMIPHHQGAINMAKAMLEQGGDEQMLVLARQILDAQEAEITQMQTWLKEHGEPRPGEQAQDIIAAGERIDQRMMAEMQLTTTGSNAGDFAQGMIPHHVAAVDMAYVLLGHSNHPGLRTMAKAVIREQEREIRELKAWQGRAGHTRFDAHSQH